MLTVHRWGVVTGPVPVASSSSWCRAPFLVGGNDERRLVTGDASVADWDFGRESWRTLPSLRRTRDMTACRELLIAELVVVPGDLDSLQTLTAVDVSTTLIAFRTLCIDLHRHDLRRLSDHVDWILQYAVSQFARFSFVSSVTRPRGLPAQVQLL